MRLDAGHWSLVTFTKHKGQRTNIQHSENHRDRCNLLNLFVCLMPIPQNIMMQLVAVLTLTVILVVIPIPTRG